jgi:hypothetical protein
VVAAEGRAEALNVADVSGCEDKIDSVGVWGDVVGGARVGDNLCNEMQGAV